MYPAYVYGRFRGWGLPALLALLLLVTAGCARGGTPPDVPPPAKAVAPMDLGGQSVLVLPLQEVQGIAQGRDEASAEVLFALEERDARTRWISPERLRGALRRSPRFAQDPGALPHDPFVHHGERRIVEPLVGVVRRYAALTDARLVLIPRTAQWLPAEDGSGGWIRLSAAVVDVRTGAVVWFGDADGKTGTPDDPALLPSAAAALAARMLAASGG